MAASKTLRSACLQLPALGDSDMPSFYMGKGYINSDPQILTKHNQPAPYLLSQFSALLFYFTVFETGSQMV